MPGYDWLYNAGETWLGKTVEFTLLGQRVRGRVREIELNMPFGRCVIAEFHDGNKHIKVAGSYQAFRIVNDRKE